MSNFRAPKLEFGQVFGRLIVLYVDCKKSVPKRRWYRLQCVCGKEFSSRSDALISGATVSCGCKKKEHSYKHGHRRIGMKDSTYNTWSDMIQRCTNPKSPPYKWYGGRGVTVTERWLTFSNFLADMGPKPLKPRRLTIERVDNNKGYSKSNCKWATMAEQALNKREKGSCFPKKTHDSSDHLQ